MNLINSLKPVAYSVYKSMQKHPSIAGAGTGFAITLFAIAIWKYTHREIPYRVNGLNIWSGHKDKLKGKEDFLTKLQSIVTLDKPFVLTTDLEQKPLPNCFQVCWNRLWIKLGYEDQFVNIRAAKVLESIKQFVSDNRDDIYLNQSQNIDLLITSSFKQLFKEKYKEEIKEIEKLAKEIQPTSWKVVAQLDDSQIAKLPFIEDIVGAAEREEEAVNLLKRAAEFQKSLIDNRKQPLIFGTWPQEPYEFQGDPLKNAYIRLAFCYWQRKENELAKEAILCAFKDTEIVSEDWTGKFSDPKFFDFLQTTCWNLAVELPNGNHNLACKLYAAAKPWILANDASQASTLAYALDRCGRFKEAIEAYEVALKNSEGLGAKDTKRLVELYKKQNNSTRVIEIADAYFKKHQKEEKDKDDDERQISRFSEVAQKCEDSGENFCKKEIQVGFIVL